MTINRNSPMPLYYQLKQILLAQIESNALNPGDILPTESQIQEKYQVSRTTVRQALSELEAEGKVSRYRGRGTFVSKPKVSHNPGQYPNLADHLIQQGATPGWVVLSAEWVDTPMDVAKQLQISPDEKSFCLRRLRLENDDPIGYHIAYVSPTFTTSIDKTAFNSGGSLRYLRAENTLEHSTANRVLEAVSAGQEESRLLNVPTGAAMLQIIRNVLSADGTPVEYFRGVYRGDRFQYHITNMRAISAINA